MSRLAPTAAVWIAAFAASILPPSLLPATAGLSRHDLADAGFHFAPGAAMPAAATLEGDAGRTSLGAALAGKPALLVFTDYRCQSLCGIVLDQLAATLPKVPLTLGRDYNVLSVALDSSQTRSDADAFRDRHTGGTPLHASGRFLTEDAGALRQVKAAVGLVAPFDPEHGQFAHPAGLVLVDAAGRAQRVLSPFALNPFDLKLALTETGAAPASLIGHALLLCYGFNPATGLYTLRIERVLTFAAAGTVAAIAGIVLLLLWLEKRRPRRGAL